MLLTIASGDRWIIDGFGNDEAIASRITRADTVVFVDFPIWRHYWWALRRQFAASSSPPDAWYFASRQSGGLPNMTGSPFTPVHGRCECGNVTYTVSAPARELYHCHCNRCRRLHGALFATYAYVRRSDIDITTGSGGLSLYRSPLANWHFCTTCGCHLFAEHDHNPGVMWYMVATLDDGADPQYPRESEKHIFVASKSSIETIADDIPRYDEYAPASVSLTARKSDGAT